MKLRPILTIWIVFMLAGSVVWASDGELAVPGDSFSSLPEITEGVTLEPHTVEWAANIAGPLNGMTYGPVAYGGFPGGASGWVKSSFVLPETWNESDYYLLFVVSDVYDNVVDSALAIDHFEISGTSGPIVSESFESGIPDGWVLRGSGGTSSSVSGIEAKDGDYFAFIDTINTYYYQLQSLDATFEGTIPVSSNDGTIPVNSNSGTASYLASVSAEGEATTLQNVDLEIDFVGSVYLYSDSESGTISPYINGSLSLGSQSFGQATTIATGQVNSDFSGGVLTGGDMGSSLPYISYANLYFALEDISTTTMDDQSIYFSGKAVGGSGEINVVLDAPDTSSWGGTTGAILQSPDFHLKGSETISFWANFLTNDGDGFPDFALVQLYDATSSSLIATLYTADAASLFVPGFNPTDPLLPPDEDDPTDGFDFDEIFVAPNIFYYFDPIVTIGYEYMVSGNAFASVILPNETSLYAAADNWYDLWLWNGSSYYDYGTSQDITGGSSFDFIALGLGDITKFLILGIDPNAGIDPSDYTTFVTGLTFAYAGIAQVKMVPVATPEPTTIALVLTGLAGAACRKKFLNKNKL